MCHEFVMYRHEIDVIAFNVHIGTELALYHYASTISAKLPSFDYIAYSSVDRQCH